MVRVMVRHAGNLTISPFSEFIGIFPSTRTGSSLEPVNLDDDIKLREVENLIQPSAETFPYLPASSASASSTTVFELAVDYRSKKFVLDFVVDAVMSAKMSNEKGARDCTERGYQRERTRGKRKHPRSRDFGEEEIIILMIGIYACVATLG